MPSKKKKYNARFPAGRIKKIMQTDEEVGKVAQAVPVIISRTLELFVESLLKKSMEITQARNAKTLTPSHMKQCILSESRFDFLKDLVKDIPDASVQEDNENNALFEASVDKLNEPEIGLQQNTASSSSCSNSNNSNRTTTVLQYGRKIEPPKLNFSVNSLISDIDCPVPAKRHATEYEGLKTTTPITPIIINPISDIAGNVVRQDDNNIPPPPPPPLIPISRNNYVEDSLCIDEDYDN